MFPPIKSLKRPESLALRIETISERCQFHKSVAKFARATFEPLPQIPGCGTETAQARPCPPCAPDAIARPSPNSNRPSIRRLRSRRPALGRRSAGFARVPSLDWWWELLTTSFIRSGQLRELRSGLNPRCVKGLWRVLLAVPFVLDLRADVAGNILDERASQKHVEALNAEADRQNRLMLGEGVLQEREIGPFAVRVRIGGFRLSSGADNARDQRLRGFRSEPPHPEFVRVAGVRQMKAGLTRERVLHRRREPLPDIFRAWRSSLLTSSFLVRYGTPTRGLGLVSRLMKGTSYHRGTAPATGAWRSDVVAHGFEETSSIRLTCEIVRDGADSSRPSAWRVFSAGACRPM